MLPIIILQISLLSSVFAFFDPILLDGKMLNGMIVIRLELFNKYL